MALSPQMSAPFFSAQEKEAPSLRREQGDGLREGGGGLTGAAGARKDRPLGVLWDPAEPPGSDAF